MKNVILILSMFFLVSHPARADRTFQFRGYTAMNQLLQGRIFRESASRVFAYYFDGQYHPRVAGDLVDLLGTYKGGGLTGEIINASPNPINTLLYYVGFTGLSKDVASICDPASPFLEVANPDLVQALHPLCTFPVSDEVLKQALQNTWFIMMAYDAPGDVFNVWSSHVFSQKANYANPAEMIQSLTVTLLMDPYFLLSQ